MNSNSERGQRFEDTTDSSAAQRRSAREAALSGKIENAKVQMKHLREAGKNLGGQIEEQARKRPFVVVGTAAGLGFVAGSLFGSRLGQVVLAGALGYLAKNVMAGDVGMQRIQEGIERLTRDRAKG